jgi:hypothetical protein
LPEDNGERVSFTVKELLARIESKLDTLAANQTNKADVAELAKVDHRVEILEVDKNARDGARPHYERLLQEFYVLQKARQDDRDKLDIIVTEGGGPRELRMRVEALERSQAGSDALSTFKRWAGPAVLGAIFMAANYLAAHWR